MLLCALLLSQRALPLALACALAATLAKESGFAAFGLLALADVARAAPFYAARRARAEAPTLAAFARRWPTLPVAQRAVAIWSTALAYLVVR